MFNLLCDGSVFICWWKIPTSRYKNVWKPITLSQYGPDRCQVINSVCWTVFSLALTECGYQCFHFPWALVTSLAQGHGRGNRRIFFLLHDTRQDFDLWDGVQELWIWCWVIKELGNPNSEAPPENWVTYLWTTPAFLSHCSAEILLYHSYTHN